MHRIRKRVMAILMIILLVLSVIPPNVVAASEITEEEAETSSMQESLQDALEVDTETELESTETEPVDTEAETENTDEVTVEAENTEAELINIQEQNSVGSESTEDAAEDEQEASYLLNYILVDKPYIQTPDTQNIVVSIGNEEIQIESAALTYYNQANGSILQVEAKNIIQNGILFSIDFSDASQTGTYVLSSISYWVNGESHTIILAEVSDEIFFGVNTEVDTNPDAVVVDQEDDISLDVVTLDEAGNQTSASSIEEAIENAQADIPTPMLSSSENSNTGRKIVVVLDPGHDSTHAGASANGIKEEVVNFKIAQYCKAELEQYYGVTVYMTRDSEACPNPGTTSTADNAARVAYAASVGANVYVSIHNNSAGSSAHGVEIYYPNSNYNAAVGEIGSQLADKILSQLTALGLYNRGTKIRNSGDNTLYPDGSLADYYGVIKRSKEVGIPAIIIEHAYLTNASDVSNYLSTEEQLKALGIADATGIAQYFGLSKTNGVDITCTPTNTGIDINAQLYESVAGTQYRYLQYNLSSKEWTLISDWTSAEQVEWKAEKGDFWVHVEALTPDGSYYEDTITYSTNLDYTKPYVDLSSFCIMKRLTGISAGVNYVSNDPDIQFQWKAYNLQTKQWEMVSGWSTGNWTFWKPEQGDYWLRVEAKTSDGVVAAYTEVYTSDKDYKHGYVDFIDFNIQEQTNGIAVGVAYESNDTNVQFQWKAYNLQTKQWEMISSWSSSNWTFWKPEQGDYWLRVEAKTSDGVEANYTKVYTSDTNYAHNYIELGEYCVQEQSNGVAVGVVYTTNDENVQFQWKAYNLQTKQWEMVSGWSSSNWTFWKPEKGDYWLRVEAKTSDGVEADYTTVYTSNYDYTQEYLDLKGIQVTDNGISYDLYSNYQSNAQSVSTRWLIYDLQKQEWTLLKNWSSDNTANWNPATGYYWIQAEVMTASGLTATCCIAYEVTARYGIMGTTQTTLEQMVNYYNANATYPAYYSSSDAPTIQAFCQIYLEECAAEGVKAEVAFCQAMKETGFLRYGGRVDISQYNFAGLGATDGGENGASFSSVREGIRAQVQHLKAYATTDALNNACVDPRFSLVTRGCAPYVEWLGIQENPYGKGWASAAKYGYSIKNDYIAKLLTY